MIARLTYYEKDPVGFEEDKDMSETENPIVPSLWTDCLFEVIAKAKEEGRDYVNFKDVDDLVLEKSKEGGAKT